MVGRPAHPAALQTISDHDLVVALDDAAADRKALGTEGRVLELVEPRLDIAEGRRDASDARRPCSPWI
jgi:hypothetical protein